MAEQLTMASSRRRWIALALGVLAVLAVWAWAAFELVQLLDPDRPARELALRDAQAAGRLDYAQLWRDHSACWQSRHPQADWISSQRLGQAEPPHRAPVDTQYTVVAVEDQGPYRRVEVREAPPGYQPRDVEIDVREYAGRWVFVDAGELGHQIEDDCQGGHGL
jgi:hypothetical protein